MRRDRGTWGTGPDAEIGRIASGANNDSLFSVNNENSGVQPGLSKRAVLADAKKIQNLLFRTMFKDKIWTARVVARLYPKP